MPRTVFDDVNYNLDVGDPPAAVLDYAKERWNETEKTRPVKIEELRQLINSNDEIEPDRQDDAYLLKFLRARNFHVDKAYELLVSYCQFKEDNPDFHEGVRPVDLFELGEEDIVNVLPFREQTGRRIMIYKLGNWIPGERPIVQLFRATLTLLELGILEQRAQILGGIAIFDLQGLSLSHAWQITPKVAYQVIQLMVTSFPMKVHALHVVFQSWVFDIMFNMFKPFMTEKMRNKLFLHGEDMDSLHKHIEPKFLPKKYGGLRPNRISYKKWVEGFRSSKFIMDELISMGYVFDEAELVTPIVETESDESSSVEESEENDSKEE